MEEQTPTFNKVTQESSSFSAQCEIFSKFKPKKRFSLLETKTIENNDNFQEKKNHNKHNHKHKHKRRHHSEFRKNRNSTFHHDIKNIMKKNKFKLRNDFDNGNVKEFLLSKEKAFEVPLF